MHPFSQCTIFVKVFNWQTKRAERNLSGWLGRRREHIFLMKAIMSRWYKHNFCFGFSTLSPGYVSVRLVPVCGHDEI